MQNMVIYQENDTYENRLNWDIVQEPLSKHQYETMSEGNLTTQFF